MRYIAAGVALALATSWVTSVHASPDKCPDLLPKAESELTPTRKLTPEDLVTLRDIGPVDPEDKRAPILAISPDHTRMAFQIRQANIETNRYCLGMVVLPLSKTAAPRLVDVGGDYMKVVYVTTGFADYTSPGAAAVVEAKWSPDGAWIAYLRRDAGRTQLWRARADGGDAQAISDVPFDIEDFAWTAGGSGLVVSGRPHLKEAEIAQVQEGRSGYLFDDRYVPVVSSKPLVREPVPVETFVIDAGTKAIRLAVPTEAKRLVPPDLAGLPPTARLATLSERGAVAWIQQPDGDTDLVAPTRLYVRDGREMICEASTCTQVISLWWSNDQTRVIYLRSEGEPHGRNGLYEWKPGAGAPRQILTTDDVLIGCQVVGATLICGREGALQPRRIVAIDLASGRERVMFDPNPEFRTLQLGMAQRLYWKNEFGLETHGDLVLPTAYRPGDKVPLIVVQYLSRGFLRGGTGNEFPIRAFASRGYAVLSFQSPASIGLAKGVKTYAEVNRRDRIDWADRKSIISSLHTGVQMLIDQGIVDPARIGLTGLSDGSSTAQFELVNGKMFAAMAVGTCCDEPVIVNTLDGPVIGAFFHKMGYPTLTEPDDAFWRPVSLRMNAHKIETPLLMQLPDREYLGALEAYTALKELHKPVEMFVFPDEYHIKWQPEHQLASFNRTLDWFDFWLRAKEDPAPEKAEQYTRWETMRAERDKRLGATPGP
ncbi:Atxe2 family lasso peptide isopeptidase [Asticcacaulis sp.]|uniref:Atxe2 family lasso peptide isopeptidase n=1 Tax=Asticcacaulis sp. TaxID=1872648 RepID=UPI002C54CB15|nr:Atxe2 family lasso peptide isopeptidase [Asticcacaulis sp.]HTM81899.1 Atxe2 family lasso peptide isopeptidase [Asticcacaulis sp.]